jgi:5-methylcytosine-specific restriction endonuclease McrA
MPKKKNINRQKGRQKSYKRLADFKPEEVLPLTSSGAAPREFVIRGEAFKVKMASARYSCFKKSLACVTCGIVGTKMILELPPNTNIPHFNLYAVDDQQQLILMTKDHIIPKSRGGKDSLRNFQTMCTICNCEKADKI